MITPEKSEILGLLCSEGCHFIHKWRCMVYYKDRGKRYLRSGTTERIEFSNTDMRLLKRFQMLFFKSYGVNPKITVKPNSDNKILIIRKHLVNDLLLYSDYGWRKWMVPKTLFQSGEDSRAAFIRGLYEGDGTKLQWRGKQPHLEFHMKNMEGLGQVMSLLKTIGIDSKLYPRSWKLIIKGYKDVGQFADVVKPNYKIVKISGGSEVG